MKKKCQPLNCNYFKSRFDKYYEKVLADALFLGCGFRDKQTNECRNTKEELKQTVIQ